MNNKITELKQNKPELERLFHKYSNNLVVNGLSVIFFGLWTLFKYFIVLTLDDTNIGSYLDDYNDFDDLDIAIYYILLTAIVLLITFLHYYIGRSAILAGRGKKKKRLYLVFALILFLLNTYNFSYYFTDEPYSPDTTIATILVDLAFEFALIDLFYSSFKLEWIKKNLGRM